MARLRMPVELVNMVIEVQSQKKKELEFHLCLEGCKRLHECGLLVDTEAQMTEKEKRKMRNEVIYHFRVAFSNLRCLEIQKMMMT
jgi:hypothetical protein